MTNALPTSLSPDDIRERLYQLRNDSNRPLEEVLKEAEELADKAHELNELEIECSILIFLGRGYRLASRAFKSINALNRSYITLNNNFIHNKELLAQIFRELCNVYSNSLKDYHTAIDYCMKGYRLNVKELNPIFMNNLGSNYISLNQFDKAQEYLRDGITLAKSTGDHTTSFLYHNLANVTNKMGKPDEALKLFNTVLDQCEAFLGSPHENLKVWNINYIKAFTYKEISEIHLQQGDKEKARKYISIGQSFSQETDQHACLSNLLFLEANLLLAEKNDIAFDELYEASIKFCNKHNFLVDKKNWLQIRQEYFEKKQDFENAYKVTKELIANEAETQSKHKELNISQMLVSKEEEILSLENKNRIMKLQQNELQQFAYIVTHDLKTPLTTISNFSGLVNKKYGETLTIREGNILII